MKKLFNLSNPQKTLYLFAIEGILFQFCMTVGGATGIGNNLYATNLGATNSQLGMIQMVCNLVAVALLLPAGIIGDRLKSSRTIPMLSLVFIGIMYFFYGTVPALGDMRMIFFFVFLGLTAGILQLYNAQWQAFFGDVTQERERNFVYAFRNRFVFLIGTIAPLLCGLAVSAADSSEGKLMALRIFYYACGVLCLVNAFVLSRIKGGTRPAEVMADMQKFRLSDIGDALRAIVRDKNFLIYFGCIMLFYMTWHLDWSMWYIGQTQYCNLTEAHLSYFNALNCIAQLFSIGLFARLNEKRGVHFSFLFGILSLMLCPAFMMLSGVAPEGMRPWTFILVGSLCCIPQSGLNLCLVQMLLDVAPRKNRSLIISLHMAAVTLSNAIMPFLGVELYTALGADRTAFFLFNSVVLVLRMLVMLLFVLRYLHIRRVGTGNGGTLGATQTCLRG